MLATLPITDPLEAISKWLPKDATGIHANAHTWRMLKARSGNVLIQEERDRALMGEGVFGYAWDITLLIDDTLPDGTFSYELDSKDRRGHVAIQGITFQGGNPGGTYYYGPDDLGRLPEVKS